MYPERLNRRYKNIVFFHFVQLLVKTFLIFLTTLNFDRRYTNRETRLARQMLEHIKTEKKWTSNVERPFVLGI